MKAFLTKHSGLVSLILIIFLAIGVYLNSLNNDFSLDDEDFIIGSDFIKNWQNAFAVFTPAYLDISAKHVDLNRPVMTWSLMSDYHVWGMNPFGYHLTNILLHTINTLLIYSLGILLLKDLKVSLLAAIIFGVHPVHTEAVNGINFREDLLVTTFFVLSLITFIKARRKLSLLLFACALLSKESAIVFPLILLLYQYISVKDIGLRTAFNRNKGYSVGMMLIGVAYLAGLSVLLNKTDIPKVEFFGIGWYQTTATAGAIIENYVKLFSFPIQLSIEYDPPILKSIFNIRALLGIGFVAGSFMYSTILLKKRAMDSFFVFWFLITLIPVAGTFYQQPSAERFLYLPSVGVVFLMASLSVFIYEKIVAPDIGKVVILLIFSIIFSYSLICIHRNKAWKDDYSLWSDAVMKAPGSQRAKFNLGRQYHKRKDYPNALKYYVQTVQKNSADMIGVIDPIKSLTNIGVIYGEMGKHDLAVRYLEEAMKREPQNAVSHYNLGITYYKQGRYDEAISEFSIALKLKPDYKETYQNIEALRKKTGRDQDKK